MSEQSMYPPLDGDETALDGNSGVDVSRRIEWLVDTALIRLADGEAGWSSLYRDPGDGRLWELTYPSSWMHGGGPPRLDVIDGDTARSKYRVAG